jgi:hypothetical protein
MRAIEQTERSRTAERSWLSAEGIRLFTSLLLAFAAAFFTFFATTRL